MPAEDCVWHCAVVVSVAVVVCCVWARSSSAAVSDPTLHATFYEGHLRPHPRLHAAPSPRRDASPDSEFVYVKRLDEPIAALNGLRARDWVYDRPLIVLHDTDPARDALERLHASRSSCALVYDGAGTLAGVLDLLDVVRCGLRGLLGSAAAPPVRTLIRTCTVAPDTLSLGDLCRHLRAGARHIAIASSTTTTHQIVSQRAVAQALYDIAQSDDCLRRQLTSSSAATAGFVRDVIACDAAGTARAAFVSMATYGITSLPVCDQSHAVGVISATDILYSRHDDARLDENVMEYILHSREDAGVLRNPRCVVSCVPSASLHSVLETMLRTRVHHVYVLDGQKPRGVISFVDILRCV